MEVTDKVKEEVATEEIEEATGASEQQIAEGTTDKTSKVESDAQEKIMLTTMTPPPSLPQQATQTDS